MIFFPQIYQAAPDTVRGDNRIKPYMPALRLQSPGAQELAIVTLSGHRIGHEPSPQDWATLFAQASDMFDALCELAYNRDEDYLHEDDRQMLIDAMGALVEKEEE